MKPYYLIDGYNLLFSFAEPDSLQSLREEMILFLKKNFAKKRLSGMIVFDGAHRSDEESGLSFASPLVIAYAPKGVTADSYLIEQIELSKYPKQMILITNDKGLTRHARSAGAKVLNNEEFIYWISKKSKTAERPEPKESKWQFERLLQIFEERLKEDSDKD